MNIMDLNSTSRHLLLLPIKTQQLQRTELNMRYNELVQILQLLKIFLGKFEFNATHSIEIQRVY